MGETKILWKIRLEKKHKPTGSTKHYLGSDSAPVPHELRIVQYSGDSGFYLLYCDESGVEFTDTYHETADAAMDQANFEFHVKTEDWKEHP